MNSDEMRLQATKAVWVALTLIFVTMFVVAGVFGDGIEAGHVWLGIILAGAGMGSTSFIWGDGNKSDETETGEMQEKAKRDQIDAVLRDLSDEDLVRLKQRLEDGTIDDDLLYEHMTLTDDGELIPLERKNE
ncbi:MAG: hypothetical protein AAF846_29560 [Chloroflexota bacterium]